ncbi:hypothetical protein ACN47E_000364 [Coniothyrium glycines]
MAPVDRREHRQQRVRGAGPSSVQATFGFSFGALGAKAAKQTSLPPQLSSSRTPVRGTPLSTGGSTQRHRTASVSRSGSLKPKKTVIDLNVTPQLGKRKRGSPSAQPSTDKVDEDELSPDREDILRSVEQSRRVIGTISPIREEPGEIPDELSILEDSVNTSRKIVVDNSTTVTNGTPRSISARKQPPGSRMRPRALSPNELQAQAGTVRRSVSRLSMSIGREVVAPGRLLAKKPKVASASQDRIGSDTAGGDIIDEESEDELSPSKPDTGTTGLPRKTTTPQEDAQEQLEMDADELSSLLQPSPTQNISTVIEPIVQQKSMSRPPGYRDTESGPVKRKRPSKTDAQRNDQTTASASTKPARRGRPPKHVESQPAQDEATVMSRNGSKQSSEVAPLQNGADRILGERSQDMETIGPRHIQAGSPVEEVVNLAEREDLNDDEEREDREASALGSQPSTKRRPHKQSSRITSPAKKTRGSQQKLSGIKQAISVMRIKGSTVRGVTVADTARTILEENIDHRLTRMTERLQNSQDSIKRKELRGEINLTLSFKESMNEKLLDLQDANDVLSTNFKKMKLFKSDNAKLRKDILNLQNSRQEVALEHDDLQAQYEFRKAQAEARNSLNINLFDIESAVRNGRNRAREEGREDEGPTVPLTMLLETVSRDVGASGGGLLENVKRFNGVLERAARWLESRA